jgi:hypothetical protein
MLHLSSALLKELTKQYSKAILNEMWTKVNQMILNSKLFQSQLAKYGGSTFAAFFEDLKSMADELESETESETTSNSYTTAPSHKMPLIVGTLKDGYIRNVPLPRLSPWTE